MKDWSLAKRYLWLVVVVSLLSLIGYLGYVFYPRFNLSAANTGLLLLAVTAGLASLFSPCSFPLLLTLLVREAKPDGRLLRSATAFITGMTLFLVLVGLALTLGAGDWISAITFTSVAGRLLRLVAGLVLIGFGLWQARGESLRFSWYNRILEPLWTKQAQLRRRQTTVSYSLYGFGYILAGFG